MIVTACGIAAKCRALRKARPAGSRPKHGDTIPDYLDPSEQARLSTAPMILADYYTTTGDKRYELSNHLGNVLSVINDRKIVHEGMELQESAFFDQSASGWKPYLDAEVEVSKERSLYVLGNTAGAGTIHIIEAYREGFSNILQLYVNRDSIPPARELLFIKNNHYAIKINMDKNSCVFFG
jgi:hypothetical protein